MSIKPCPSARATVLLTELSVPEKSFNVNATLKLFLNFEFKLEKLFFRVIVVLFVVYCVVIITVCFFAVKFLLEFVNEFYIAILAMSSRQARCIFGCDTFGKYCTY